LYALRRGGTCRCGAAITGGHWIGGGWSASVSPTTPLRVLTIMGCRETCQSNGGSTLV